MKKRIYAIAVISMMSLSVALVSKVNPDVSNVWLGVTYAMGKKGYSSEAQFCIGVMGLAQATLYGSAAGPAGTLMGVGFGL